MCHQIVPWGHGSGGSSWGGLWEQLSPIISWIGAETRVYGAIQVETLLSVMYVSEWDEQSDLDLSTGSSTVLHVCI